MNSARFAIGLWAAMTIASDAHAVAIDTVLVGNAGNAPDTEVMVQDGTTGYGDVPYEYRIGKYEVTNAQYTEFLNAVDPTGANSLLLYNNFISSSEHGGITRDAIADDGSKYKIKTGRGDNPVLYVSWYDAIRFANWMHNGQGSGDTETGAYTLMEMLDTTNNEPKGATISRNPGARWFLPSENEWYKAAYHKNDGVTGNYWDYPTGADVPPTPAVPPGSADSANYAGAIGTISSVGAYPLSASPYGTFDQGGNLYEWNEALMIQRHELGHVDNYFRGLRGGSWLGVGGHQSLAASGRPASGCDGGSNPTCYSLSWGFRMASISNVPEPSSLLLSAFVAALFVPKLQRFR